MIKARASQLKAKMGQYMRAVRAGREVLITDRDEPVAKLVPVRPASSQTSLPVSQPRDPSAEALGAVRVRSVRVRGVNSLALLLEDRARR